MTTANTGCQRETAAAAQDRVSNGRFPTIDEVDTGSQTDSVACGRYGVTTDGWFPTVDEVDSRSVFFSVTPRKKSVISDIVCPSAMV